MTTTSGKSLTSPIIRSPPSESSCREGRLAHASRLSQGNRAHVAHCESDYRADNHVASLQLRHVVGVHPQVLGEGALREACCLSQSPELRGVVVREPYAS